MSNISLQTLLRVVDALPQGVILLNDDAYIVYTNVFTINLLGNKREDCSGVSYASFAAMHDLPVLPITRPQTVVGKKNVFVIEAREVRIQDDKIYTLLLLSMIRPEVDRANRFIAHISHEYRMPVTVIRGFSELLLQQSHLLSDDQREFVEIIRGRAYDLAEVISQVLQYIRITEGSEDVVNEITNISHIVENVVRSVGNQYRRKAVACVIESNSEEILLFIDPRHLYSIIHHLLDSAYRYSNEQGKVSVTLEAEGDWVEIRISDTGAGIEQRQGVGAFQESSQKREEEHDYLPGTGSGLVIAKKLIDIHGGVVNISVEQDEINVITVMFKKNIGE